MKNILLLSCVIFICVYSITSASQFEELDKPPEGAHEGQMLLGGYVSIGFPYGNIISGEEDFVQYNQYTFDESEITKELLVTHLSYDFGISFEYMPIDYVGIKSKLKRTIIVQRTRFGADFQNWNETLYSNYALMLGPAFHLTNRKQWDVTFTPVIGFAAAEYTATPIADKLLSTYSGDGNRDVNSIAYGAELNLTIYFSGGLYISIGSDWNMYPIKFDPGYSLSQNINSTTIYFLDKENSGSIQTFNLVISAGYAFSN